MLFEKKSLRYERFIIFFINALAILFHGFILLIGTKYIIAKQVSYLLLETINAIPFSPIFVLLTSSCLYGLLVIILLLHDRIEDERHQFKFLIGELVVTLLLTIVLNDSYNGYVLLIVMDTIYHSKKRSYWALGSGLTLFLWLLSQNGFMDYIYKMPSLDAYITMFPLSTQVSIFFVKNMLTSLNTIIFIIFLVSIIVTEQGELIAAQREIELAAKVNTDLENYVTLVEKIAEDNERKRIARELHDTLGHVLSGLSAGVEACLVLIKINPDQAYNQLEKISHSLINGIKDVRRSLEHLRPGALEENNFKKALWQMLSEYQELSGLSIDLYDEWKDVSLSSLEEDTIYRVIQESITNALRHGHAQKVEISLFTDDSHYILAIQDDGIGFTELVYGYGLTQMIERINHIGATIQFMNLNGFRTYIEIPKQARGETEK